MTESQRQENRRTEQPSPEHETQPLETSGHRFSKLRTAVDNRLILPLGYRVNDFLAKSLGYRVIKVRFPEGQLWKWSHSDEENILRRLVGQTGDIPRTYVDIGAGDGSFLTTTRHLAQQNWHGLCFECDREKVARLLYTYQDYPEVDVCRAKVTPANVCFFLRAYGIAQNFGFLSLDIDSYDYFILEALLGEYHPAIICAEINENIPPPLEFTVLFNPDHSWDESHFYGQSISQLEKICKRFDYALACVEYNNAFLVAKPLFNGRSLSAREAYESGYVNRGDRRQKFPWNEDTEPLLTMDPREAVEFLRASFKKYDGKYLLSSGV